MSILSVLNDAGFINISQLSDTLQGSVYKALNKSSKKNVVIKITNKYLHKNAMAITNNQQYHNIKENILSEASILKYLSTQKNLPQSIIKFDDFYECNFNYYLVMEHGGMSLYDFIVKAHRLISIKHINICEWHKVVKIIFKQMLESIEFIHDHNVCHMDLSLENFLINDVKIHYFENVNNKKESESRVGFNCDDIQIKLIDFGLSSIFKIKKNNKNNFQSQKYCGKVSYKSPEIKSKKTFDAKSNDYWTLGICLFMMIFGCAPWHVADKSDKLFVLIMDGYLTDVLVSWNKFEYANKELINLFTLFFQYQEKRINLDQIVQHSWLKN